ncbi:hypothetical protein TEQG_03216 [Trichophyton equinum CBS 127.97]|uniref:Uncharacterized protein n=1 Tax=Trichophyton equinum (strain ATCC MYA-4606 / CBS 127.97) TaxID=559882 RepID=F2PQL6_TRIEC|nr:hypothetical protein TEQG_03216 [Trichophyton equinum CBS 127.97]
MSNNDFLHLLRLLARHLQDHPETYVKTHLNSLSEDERSVFKRLSHMLPTKPVNSSKKKTIAIERITDITTIELSASLKGCLKAWARNPSLFFEGAVDGPRNYRTVAEIFSRIRHDENARGISMIKRRFDLTALYRFAVSYNLHTGRSWRSGGFYKFATIIYNNLPQYGGEDVNSIIQEVKRCVALGQGFHTWSEKLGGLGYLLIMPLELCETRYADRHHHANIEKGVSHLVNIGIRGVAEEWQTLPVGDYILHHILEYLNQPTPPTGAARSPLRSRVSRPDQASRKRRCPNVLQPSNAHRSVHHPQILQGQAEDAEPRHSPLYVQAGEASTGLETNYQSGSQLPPLTPGSVHVGSTYPGGNFEARHHETRTNIHSGLRDLSVRMLVDGTLEARQPTSQIATNISSSYGAQNQYQAHQPPHQMCNASQVQCAMPVLPSDALDYISTSSVSQSSALQPDKTSMYALQIGSPPNNILNYAGEVVNDIFIPDRHVFDSQFISMQPSDVLAYIE